MRSLHSVFSFCTCCPLFLVFNFNFTFGAAIKLQQRLTISHIFCVARVSLCKAGFLVFRLPWPVKSGMESSVVIPNLIALFFWVQLAAAAAPALAFTYAACCVICNLCEMRCQNIKTSQSLGSSLSLAHINLFLFLACQKESLSIAQWLSWLRWENIAIRCNFIWWCL